MHPTGLPCPRCIFLLLALLAQTALHSQPQAVNPALPVAAAASTQVNALTQAVVQQGTLNCAVRINQVSNYLGFGPQSGALLMLPASQPDQHLLPISLEMQAEGATAYVSASFAPNQANGCGAVYESVVYWAQACEALAGKQFATLKRVGPIKTHITVLDGGAALKVFLMPAGSGCLAIKKEIVL